MRGLATLDARWTLADSETSRSKLLSRARAPGASIGIDRRAVSGAHCAVTAGCVQRKMPNKCLPAARGNGWLPC